MARKNGVGGSGNMETRVDSAETPAAAGQAGVPPTPGGEHEEEIPVVVVNLEELYDAVGGPMNSASDILEGILKAWGVKYSLLCNSSPDVGDEYYDEEFKNLLDEYYDKEEEIDEDPYVLAALRIAAQRGADAVIDFRDGYESALALVWRGEWR